MFLRWRWNSVDDFVEFEPSQLFLVKEGYQFAQACAGLGDGCRVGECAAGELLFEGGFLGGERFYLG